VTARLLLSACLALWVGVPCLALLDRPDTRRRAWPWTIGLGALALAGALLASIGRPAIDGRAPSPFAIASQPIAFHFDPLAAWFLVPIAGIALCLAPYLHAYMAHVKSDRRWFWVCLPWLLASMAAVVLAANAQTFLAAWEVMSLTSFVLVLTTHGRAATRRAALIYLGATRAGSACLAGGLLWAYALTGSWTFADWHLHGAPALGPGLLILVGVGVKAGMWPFHLWLPLAHPAAPTPVSAVMSGVMVKVGVYAMIRFFLLPGPLDVVALGHLLLALGAVSAFWGVLFALLQHDLKRLLAYSTVENVGLILLAIGCAIVARHAGLPGLSALALGAALFHTWNHGAFKALLFLSAGAVECATGTRNLEHLGGLAHRMPITFASFLLGSAAICALPPLNGFASEWLLYRAFLGMGSAHVPPLHRFLALGTLGWIALVGALSLTCFMRACGTVFLGQPRKPSRSPQEVGLGMRFAQAALALICAALGLAAPLVLRGLGSVVAPLDPAGTLRSAWTIPLPATLLSLAFGAAVGWAMLASARVKRFDTWDCGFGPLQPRMQISATSFAQPVARLFGALYRWVVNVRVEGRQREHFPERISAEPDSSSILASRVYRPVLCAVDRLAARLARLQAGSIHLYLFTMFVTLWILLFLGKYVP
jgi:hydrogenase-4 component B